MHTKVLSIVLSLGYLLSSLSAFAIDIPSGFYLTSESEIYYVYQDIIKIGKKPVFALTVVGENGVILKSKPNSAGNLELFTKDGKHSASIVSYGVPGKYQVAIAENGSLVKSIGINHLGQTQRQAAKSLDINAEFARTKYFSHRGTAELVSTDSSSVFPGNTEEAMELSLMNGFNGFELDIQLTKDGVVMVSHDDKLAVSTTCKGRITEKNYDEVKHCRVRFTGFLPEKRWFHSRSEITSELPTLKHVLTEHLDDPKLKNILVDVKPAPLEKLVTGLGQLISPLTPKQKSKLILLVRDLKIKEELARNGITGPLFALEGSTGWEPLENPNFSPAGIPGISLNLGIGLGMAGLKEKGKQAKGRVLMSGLLSVWDLAENFWRGTLREAIDVATIHWVGSTQERYLDLLSEAHHSGTKIVGWTINTKDKIKWLRQASPDLDYIISDLPFHSIAEVQVQELNQLLR